MDIRKTLEWYRAETSRGVYLICVQHDYVDAVQFASANYYTRPEGVRGEGVSVAVTRGDDAYARVVEACRVHAGETGVAPAVCGAVAVDADGREVAA